MVTSCHLTDCFQSCSSMIKSFNQTSLTVAVKSRPLSKNQAVGSYVQRSLENILLKKDLHRIARNPHFRMNAQKNKTIMDMYWAKYGEMAAKDCDENREKIIMLLLYISTNFLNFQQLPSCCNILIKVCAFMPGREAKLPWARMAEKKKGGGRKMEKKKTTQQTTNFRDLVTSVFYQLFPDSITPNNCLQIGRQLRL